MYLLIIFLILLLNNNNYLVECINTEFVYPHDLKLNDFDINNNRTKTEQIPLDFIKNLNEFNVSELLLNFVEGLDNEPIFQNRFGENIEERDASISPKSAGCTPELKTIEVGQSKDPNIVYIPQCIKVERCGGCCFHPLLSCQAQTSETINFKIVKTEYNGSKKLKFVNKELVPIERHLKCKCSCKIKETDCNKYQIYKPKECQCACINKDEETKCYKKTDKKLWNSELCTCQCRNILQCSTGYRFDYNECRCVTSNIRRRYAYYFQKNLEQDNKKSN